MTRRIKIDGQTVQPLVAASSIYDEVIQEILHECYHQFLSGKCQICFKKIVGIRQDLCEPLVRRAINRLLAYQRNEIRKQSEKVACDHHFNGDNGQGGRWCIRCRSFIYSDPILPAPVDVRIPCPRHYPAMFLSNGNCSICGFHISEV